MIKGSFLVALLAGGILASFFLYFIGFNDYTQLHAKVNALTSVSITYAVGLFWYYLKGSKVAG